MSGGRLSFDLVSLLRRYCHFVLHLRSFSLSPPPFLTHSARFTRECPLASSSYVCQPTTETIPCELIRSSATRACVCASARGSNAPTPPIAPLPSFSSGFWFNGWVWPPSPMCSETCASAPLSPTLLPHLATQRALLSHPFTPPRFFLSLHLPKFFLLTFSGLRLSRRDGGSVRSSRPRVPAAHRGSAAKIRGHDDAGDDQGGVAALPAPRHAGLPYTAPRSTGLPFHR